MKAGGRANEVTPVLQSGAACRLGVFEVVAGGEMPVDERRIASPPAVFGRKEAWGIGGHEPQVNVLGHAQLGAGMPAGAIEDQDDLLVWSSADRSGEGASSATQSSMETPVARCQMIWPEAGGTNATRERHSSRCCMGAIGRWPGNAQTFLRIGL
jgi:hypothetical protein